MRHSASPVQGTLFAEEALPHGLLYRADFLTPAEEARLLGHIAPLPFAAARYQDYTARRRVVRFGEFDDPNYAGADAGAGDSPAPGQRRPFAPFLLPLRQRVAQWCGLDEADFVHALVTEYAPGTPIGWHSDAPHFGVVAGISLAGTARMQFRPYQSERLPRRRPLFEIQLAPRSAYLMRGEIRQGWQHHIPAVAGLRYSITFRTCASRPGAEAPLSAFSRAPMRLSPLRESELPWQCCHERASMKKQGCVLGIDIGGTKVLLGLYDRDFHLVAEEKFKTRVPKGRDVFRAELAERIAALRNVARKRGLRLACVGVGSACRINPKSGRITAAVNIPFLEGYPLRQRIEKMAHARTYMINDVQAGLYGEFRLGAARRARHAIAVFIGTGLGAALIIDGKLYDGATGFAGDIGNYLVHVMGPKAQAPEKEVLDNVASRRAIAGDAAKLAARHFATQNLKKIGTDGTKIKSRQLAEAVKKGDKTVRALVQERARIVGTAMSNIVDFVNPDTVILGGGLVEALPHLVRKEIKAGIETHGGRGNIAGLKIKVAALGKHAVAAGAAKFALDMKEGKQASAERP